MFKVKSGKFTYTVYFRHHYAEGISHPIKTDCVIGIEREDGDFILSTLGTAALAPEDYNRFCYEKGRKIALTRALVELPRELRKPFWDKYFSLGKKTAYGRSV